MIEFVTGCAGLFTSTFNAAAGEDFFLFLMCYLVVNMGFGLFFGLSRRLWKV